MIIATVITFTIIGFLFPLIGMMNRPVRFYRLTRAKKHIPLEKHHETRNYCYRFA